MTNDLLKSVSKEEREICISKGYIISDKYLGGGVVSRIFLGEAQPEKIENSEKLKLIRESPGKPLKVAIKIIYADVGTDLVQLLAKYVPNEIANMERVYGHPNILMLLDVFVSCKRIFLVLEYASRGTLADLYRKLVANKDTDPFMEEAEARYYYHDIMNGLEYLHRHNIAHRDLKMENILIGDDGRIKLSDFGFSTACLGMDGGQDSTCACLREKAKLSTVGTPGYMAPEFVSASCGYNAIKADIYSVGVILYALVNGCFPFEVEVNAENKSGEKRLCFRRHLSQDCKELITSLLLPTPDHRPSAIEALTLFQRFWFGRKYPYEIRSRGFWMWKDEITEIKANKFYEFQARYVRSYLHQRSLLLQNIRRKLLRDKQLPAKVLSEFGIRVLLPYKDTRHEEVAEIWRIGAPAPAGGQGECLAETEPDQQQDPCRGLRVPWRWATDQERESVRYHPVKRVIEKLTLIDKWYSIRKMDITPLTEMDKCIYMWNTVHLGFGECWPLDEELAPPSDEQVYHTVPLSSSFGKYEDPNAICLKMSYISPYFKGSDVLVANVATEPPVEKSEEQNRSMCEAEGIPEDESSQSAATASQDDVSIASQKDNTQSADATTKPSVGKRGKISSWVKSKLHGKTSKHCQNHDSLTSITERKESEVLSEVLQGKTCPEGDHHPESNSNQMEIVVGNKEETVQSSQLNGGQGDSPKLFTREERTISAATRNRRVVSKNIMEAGDFKLDAEAWSTEIRRNDRTEQMDCSNSSDDGEAFNGSQCAEENTHCKKNNEGQSLEGFNKHLNNVEKRDSSCWSVSTTDVEASGSENRDLPNTSVAETALPMPDVVPGIDVSPCDEVIPSGTNENCTKSPEENELSCALIAQTSDDQKEHCDRLVHDEASSVLCNNEDVAKPPTPVSSRTTSEDASVTDLEPRDLIKIAVAILKSVDVAMTKTDPPAADMICIPRNFSSSKIEASLRALENMGRAGRCSASEASGMRKSFSQKDVDVKEMEVVESARRKSTSSLSLAKMARTVGTQWPEQDAEVLGNNDSQGCKTPEENFEGKDVCFSSEDTSGNEGQSVAACSKDIDELESSQATRKTNKRSKPKRKSFLRRFLSFLRLKKAK